MEETEAACVSVVSRTCGGRDLSMELITWMKREQIQSSIRWRSKIKMEQLRRRWQLARRHGASILWTCGELGISVLQLAEHRNCSGPRRGEGFIECLTEWG
ncbi:hypothetical protein ACJRO7_030278 [Eucalyptus globulus]|uniref:Uncharacterized protein n=1 Tax=Eucalyptus globulus TaxID=34317 RepID=A0ABD3JIG8_EUCGL